MRLGIDARFFGPKETGIGRYVERLITHLGRIDQANDYFVFLRKEAYDTWTPPNARWRKIMADHHWYSLNEQRYMPGIFKAAGLDLLHIPHFNLPVLYRRPFIVTIHDLILDQFPTERATTLEPLMFWAKFQAYRFVVRQAVTRAARIITVSEHSRQDLIKRFRISADKVAVTYESVDPLPPGVEREHLRRRGIDRPYLLHVGNAYPHKNLDRLVTAWGQAQAGAPTAQLVLVGKRDYFSVRLEAEVKARAIPGVVFYGFASEAELAGLYRHAQAYVFPSLSEGFGLPGLEAMWAGTAVYAARSTCLPEIFGQAASYFDPLDVADIKRAIQRALQDDQERRRLIAAGRERLTRYDWSSMAKQTLDIYNEVREQKRPKRS